MIPNNSLRGEWERLSIIIDELEDLQRQNSVSDRLVSGLVGYACIRLSGFLEVAHERWIADSFRSRCTPEVLAYISKSNRSSRNYNTQVCLSTVEMVSVSLGQRLKSHPEMQPEGKWASAINGVYTVRNKQAHGGNQNAGVSTLRGWRRAIHEYVVFLYSDPTS